MFEHEECVAGTEDSYFNVMMKELTPKRQRMADMLTKAGMQPSIPDGSYYMIADASNLGQYHSILLTFSQMNQNK